MGSGCAGGRYSNHNQMRTGKGAVAGLEGRGFSGIKKPACGRLLGDWLDSFLVNRASLQNVHPDLASGCGTRRENHLPGRCDLSLWEGRCANVGRSILIFLRNSQLDVGDCSFTLICSSWRSLRSAIYRTQPAPVATEPAYKNGMGGRRLFRVDHQNTHPMTRIFSSSICGGRKTSSGYRLLLWLRMRIALPGTRYR